MALRDVAAALAANWDDTLPQLESGDLQLIGAAIAAMAAAKENEQAANAASAELTTLLLVRLPAGHPVRDAIASGTRFLGSSADLARIAVELGALPGLNVGSVPPLSAPAGMADPLDPVPGGVGDPASWSVDDRLLAAPAFTVRQVRERGGDPDHADLIKLPTSGGAVQLPAFQFSEDGLPIPVVTAINRLLLVAEDPWGVADWWLGGNAWLNAVPAHVLGRVDDELLTRAAQAEFPEG